MLVNIDDINTFPKEVYNYLSENINKIQLYYDEQNKIDKNERKGRFPTVEIAINKYIEDVDEIIDHIYKKIGGIDFIYYHCTKLLENEIDFIFNNGLSVLSKDLVDEKIRFLKNSKLLDNRIIEFLEYNNHISHFVRDLNHPSSDSAGRNNLVFLTNKSVLKEESATGKFFKYWGGENFYFYNYNNLNIIEELCKIGSSCIIKIKVNYEKFSEEKFKKNIAYTMCKTFFDKRHQANLRVGENSQMYEFYFEERIYPDDIIGIVRFKEEEFQKLVSTRVYKKLLKFNFHC